MALRPEDLPSDPALLIELVLALSDKVDSLKGVVATLQRLIHGPHSERLSTMVAEQLALDLADLAAVPVPANDDTATPGSSKPRSRKKRNIGSLPKHLPRCDVVIEPETTICPCCAGELHRIGEEVSETLDRIPAVLRILRTIRPKYGCRACEGAIVQAQALPRLIEGGMASTALISQIAVAKFAWGSTLYRQAQILAGQGIEIDRQTLARWMKQAAWWLKGLYELQLAEMHAGTRLFCDETPMRVLDPGRGRTKTCQFWAHATDDRAWRGPAPPAVAYVFAAGRGKEEIVQQLTGFAGVLQVDAYAAYKGLARDQRAAGAIRLAFCLAHARRKFVAVVKTTNSPLAREVVERIAAVYAIEKRIRGRTAGERLAVRQSESRPLMEALKARLEATRDGLSIHSSLLGAIDYTLNHWSGLVLFLDDGRLEPDTNIVERSIRPIGIGRRNSLFAGDAGGAETWAILASLVNTCKLNGVDPETWLTDVLERIVSGEVTNNRLHELLVWNWKIARAAAATMQAAA